jgi:beta-mannanase
VNALKAAALLVFIALAVLSLPTSASSRNVALGITGSTEQVAALKAQGMPVKVISNWVTWSEPNPDELLREAASQGATPFVNWQPEGTETRPITVPDIVAGALDPYIATWARAIAAYGGPVYFRMGHEMNGTWYPWSEAGPAAYRALWHRVVPLFRSIAPNARFVWSPDGLIGHEQRRWEKAVTRWFPGRAFVDYVGMSTVGFKTSAGYGVPYFFKRIDFLHRRYRKPVILPEMKVFQAGRYQWLAELRGALVSRPWVKMLIWSETRSTAQALGEFDTGNMNWSLANDPKARRMLLRAIGTS